MYSHVTTSGDESYAGIGGGGAVTGPVANTTAVYSTVKTEGRYASAGIGGGVVYIEGTVAHTTAVNSHVTTTGDRAYAGIGGGYILGTVDKTKAVNSFVNGNKKNFGSISYDQLLCQKADLRVLKANCSPRTEFRVALDLSSCPVPIEDAKTLGKIGRDPAYPLSGTYQQIANIVVNKDHKPIGTFTGEYDGQCHTISGLSDCFVDTLEGSISDLQFTRANITNSAKPTGLAACVVDDTGTVSNIRAKDVHIVNSGDDADAGIGGGGRVKGMVANIMAVNSHVTTLGQHADAGIGGGGEVKAGGMVANIMAVNSHVKTTGELADAGIGGGGAD
ncbi:hypothetical protein [Endozoicomonas sp. GU-1]|uniref:hypothetical protein n=1 Tax=Endozoicomonas sp. GU-1 TaxID=3009078 RepID=UPI0022B5CE06|nr:hypothetical protein [Endozoicomonas sp. GU-1]WBA83773.1 hypothetical protein O2T12_11965 [Endozoicomonas sp. GU-1]